MRSPAVWRLAILVRIVRKVDGFFTLAESRKILQIEDGRSGSVGSLRSQTHSHVPRKSVDQANFLDGGRRHTGN
jgi:hypothetical protein